MKTLNDLCQEHPDYSEQTKLTIARLSELFDNLKEAEASAERYTGSCNHAKTARAEYNEFYKTDIIYSGNPIIRALYAQ